ncbi:MAG: lipid A deacylase LpxR family protein [Rhodobacterales bacterium]|nr:lipid A deacylase LpxR family protein [Rhodobacterales bacterium]
MRALPILLTVLALVPGPALAQSGTSQPTPDDAGILTLQFQNDLFGGSDQHFTHGTRFAWLSPESRPWIENLAALMPIYDPGVKRRASYSLGQNIYTPSDITRNPPDPTDRPYAGWLYVGVGLVAEKDNRLDNVELDLGVVGPAAFADTVQTRWHRAFDLTHPEGWDHQLKNEPGVILFYERKWRMAKPLPLTWPVPLPNLAVDATPHAGLALGNVFTYGAGGVMLRLGQDLPSDYGPPRIRPSLPGGDFFRPTVNDGPLSGLGVKGFGWYVFGGAELRAVGRNIFLDGNTFADSRSVSKKFMVADFQVGLAVTLDRYRLAYTHIFRTPEFEGQGKPDQFGALSLSVRF